MKKRWLIPVLILCSIGIVYACAQYSGMLRAYNIPTASNKPTINPGDRIWVTNLKRPQRFDLICFHMDSRNGWDGGTWVFRLCGLPGDKIQLIRGILYVNSNNADSMLTIDNIYKIPETEMKKLGDDYSATHPDDILQSGNDSVSLELSTAVFKKKALVGRMFIDQEVDPSIQAVYHQPWNRDNFGPVTVPDGSYFVLGDNRHSAADSRYAGFIPQKDYVATVWKIFNK